MSIPDKIKTLILKNKFISEYFLNRGLRLYVSIFLGLITNFVYIIFNTVSGIRYAEPKFISVAFYYAILLIVRCIILNIRDGKQEGDYLYRAHNAAKISGIFLFLLPLPAAVMIFYTLLQKQIKSYSTVVFVFLAIYSISGICRAMTGIKVHVNHKRPTDRVAYIVRLASAFMSFFNLETAILSTLGYEARFALTVILMSAVALSVFLFMFALNTVRNSSKQMKRIEELL